LRRIFGPKRDEVTGEWKKLHNVELNDLYSSPNIVQVIKSRRMIILGWIFRKWDVGYGLDWAGSELKQVAGTCECCDKPSGSIKCVEFLD
jgi:hypothetical protein